MARSALFGAIGGMIIVGVAFMVPRLISETVIEPSGGASLGGSSVTSCDQVFKNQLVRNQAAGSGARMNQIKVQVQQRQEECASEVWDPLIITGTRFGRRLLGLVGVGRDLSGQGYGYCSSCCFMPPIRRSVGLSLRLLLTISTPGLSGVSRFRRTLSGS